MAMSARVTNANGRIIAEKRNGQRRYHQHDALGNTIALIDDAGTVTNTFSYWPYGELRTTVIGNLPTPFLYCGQWGYYTDTTGRIYARARNYRPALARWLTVDPFWPWESGYAYCNSGPTACIDQDGSQPKPDANCAKCGNKTRGYDFWIDHVVRMLCKNEKSGQLEKCHKSCDVDVKPRVPVDLKCLTKWCASNVKIKCEKCPEGRELKCPKGCSVDKIKVPDYCGAVPCVEQLSPEKNLITLCCNSSAEALSRKCGATGNVFVGWCEPSITLLHELGHVCGAGSGCNHDDKFPNIDKWAECMYRCLAPPPRR